MANRKSTRFSIKKLIVVGIALCIVIAMIYKWLINYNINLNGQKPIYIYIQNHYQLNDLVKILNDKKILHSEELFKHYANYLNIGDTLKGGKYEIHEGMSLRMLIYMIKKGESENVTLYFNNQIRTKEEWINYISLKTAIKKDELEAIVNNADYLQNNFNLNFENFLCAISPKNYLIKWNITINELMQQIKITYDSTVNSIDVKQLSKLNLTTTQLIILSSIVQAESRIGEEQRKIASVYINRLQKKMRLQADPTVIFANKRFEANRVLAKDKNTDSPYNTYKYKGLPPGPICLVYLNTIQNVLNYIPSTNLYFCAKADFSGYSHFTSSFEMHQQYARAYQIALNIRGIRR